MHTKNKEIAYLAPDTVETHQVVPLIDYEASKVYIARYTYIRDRNNYIGPGEVMKLQSETYRRAYAVLVPTIHFEENNDENCRVIVSTTINQENERYIFNIFNPTLQRIRLGIFTMEVIYATEIK